MRGDDDDDDDDEEGAPPTGASDEEEEEEEAARIFLSAEIRFLSAEDVRGNQRSHTADSAARASERITASSLYTR